MKRLSLIVILVSGCSFTTSQYRCEDSDEAREGFECRNEIWIQVDSDADGGQDMDDDTSRDPKCGDSLIQGAEQCDGLTFKDDCTTFNFASGTLSCTNDCQLDKSACVPKSSCGNKSFDQGEDCEPGIEFTQTCEKIEGFTGGMLTCSEACAFDTSQCDVCGDGDIGDGEICDKENFGEESCSSQTGYEAVGTLSCEDSCQTISTDNCRPIFTQIAAGYGHSCGLMSDGKIACWGRNDKNQTDVPDRKFKYVSTGEEFSCGILISNEILCWGSNGDGKRSSPPGTFLNISLGDKHGCGISTANEIICWGKEDDLRTDGLAGTFDQVHVWVAHGCAMNGPEVSCWGRTASGELDVPNKTYKYVSVGLQFTCAITSNDEVDCWGKSGTQRDDAPEGTFSSIDSSSYHVCAIASGTNFAICWGDNSNGRTTPPTPPQQYRQISTGRHHTCAIKMDGSVQCWGKNDDGESTPPPIR